MARRTNYLFSAVFFAFTAVVIDQEVQAQVLPVGTPLLEDYYRRQQLMGQVDSTVSFVIRPLRQPLLGQENVYNPGQVGGVRTDLVNTPDGEGYVQVLPVTWEHQINTGFPYGWNDGSMVPTKGYQTRVSAGLYFQYKFLSVQFRPEFVYAGNQDYENHAKQPGYGWHWYYAIGNKIDMPEYFGRGRYTRLLPGQSSVRLTFDPVSFGLSTENLWWGPGRRNSLLMSNTAPGFLHATLQTSKPIATPIGSFEGQLVGGKLDNSGFDPSITGESLHHELYYVPKPETWRYFSGLIVNYQPKWLSGLSLGLIRTFTINRSNMTNNPRDFLPFFSPVKKQAPYLDADRGTPRISDEVRDRYGSVFFRWAMPKDGFEVYAEYGRRERPENGRDGMVRMERSRAYIFGLSKIVPLRRSSGAALQFNAEVTQLAAPNVRKDLFTEPWYTHHVVRDGYTHLGQVLGAGIGPSSNIQSVDISWVRGLQQIGLEVERFVHNEDFFYYYIADIRRSWTDLGIGAFAAWDVGPVLLSGALKFTHAYNYQHMWVPPVTDFWAFGRHDRNNVHLRFGASYRF